MSITQRIAFTVESLEDGEDIDPENLGRVIATLNSLLAHGDLDLRVVDYAAAVEDE